MDHGGTPEGGDVARRAAADGSRPAFLLDCRGIEKSYGATVVLKGADLRVAAGEIHAFLGGNGAGKSTLIRIVSGAAKADGGSVHVCGSPVFDRHQVAVVFQELALLPHLSVAENIDLPNRRRGLAGVGGRRQFDRSADALALLDVDLARTALERPVADLDLHQRQLVEIARALGSGARAILLDEPTANLTFAESERLFLILRRLKQRGIAIVLVSHRMSEIRTVADVCTILRDGRTVVDRRPLSELSDAGIVEAMGQQTADAPRARPAGVGKATAKGRQRGITALRLVGGGLEVEPARGSILGLAGAPAGPADLIGALIGARRSQVWRIESGGTPFAPESPADAVRAGVGYVSGDRAGKGLLAALPILDNIAAGARVALRRRWTSRREADGAARALDLLSIRARSVDDLPSTLSGGTQQKLLLARWMDNPPKILVLEEPTRGVDIGTKREIYALMRRMAAEGSTIVWWSTEFSELAALCATVVAFRLDGRPSVVIDEAGMDEVSLARATGMAA